MAKVKIFCGFECYGSDHRKLKIQKKYFNRFNWTISCIKVKIGDIVNSCDGFNHKIDDLHPRYTSFNGVYILNDIDLYFDDGSSCSLKYCGIENKKSKQEIVENNIKMVEAGLKNSENPNDFFSKSDYEAIKFKIEADTFVTEEGFRL